METEPIRLSGRRWHHFRVNDTAGLTGRGWQHIGFTDQQLDHPAMRDASILFGQYLLDASETYLDRISRNSQDVANGRFGLGGSVHKYFEDSLELCCALMESCAGGGRWFQQIVNYALSWATCAGDMKSTGKVQDFSADEFAYIRKVAARFGGRTTVLPPLDSGGGTVGLIVSPFGGCNRAIIKGDGHVTSVLGDSNMPYEVFIANLRETEHISEGRLPAANDQIAWFGEALAGFGFGSEWERAVVTEKFTQ